MTESGFTRRDPVISEKHPKPAPAVWLMLEDHNQAKAMSRLVQRNMIAARLIPAGDAIRGAVSNAETPPLAIIAGIETCVLLAADWGDWMRLNQVSLIALIDDDSVATHLRARESGCSHVMRLPLDMARLVTLLDMLACACGREPWRVMLLSENPDERNFLVELLADKGLDPFLVTHGSQLFSALDEFSPEVLLLGDTSSISPQELMAVVHARNWELAGATLCLSELEPDYPSMTVSARLAQELWETLLALLERSRSKACRTSGLRRLLAEQARMNAAINAHAILSVTDAGGNILEINDKFTEISGYTESELLGRNHRVLKSGLHDKDFYRSMWRTIHSGLTWHGEICNRRKDGSLYWVESSITPLVDAKGRIEGYISLRTDISHTKNNQLRLQGLAAISNLEDSEFMAAAAEWLAHSLQVSIAFVTILDPRPGDLRTLALWKDGALNENISYAMAGTPCEVVHQEAMALYVTGVSRQFPRDLWLSENAIDSYLGIAFRGPDGFIIGHVGIMDDKPLRDWGDKLEWLSILAPRLSLIVQRTQYQQELMKRENQYRTLTQNIPGMVYRVSSAREVEFISGSVPITGQEEQHFLANRQHWLKLIHPDDYERVRDECSALEKNAVEMIQQYRINHRDGSVRWVSDHKRSLFDETACFAGVDGVVFDITAMKQIELANAIDKERLVRSQRYANIGTWDWNIRTSELYWTDWVPVLFGYGEGGLETTYENFLAVIHPEDRQQVIDGIDRCIRENVPYEMEHRVVWPDGTVRWLLERGDVIRDEHGQPLHMLGVVQDIDDRKRTELALAESEAQLRAAQALAHIGNWCADFRTGALTWSLEIYRIFGCDPSGFTPSVASFHAVVHPDDLTMVLEAENRARQTGALDVVHRIVRSDGAIRYVHELARTEFDDTGNFVGMTGTVQDVTQQVKVQQALVNAREEAEHANRAKTEFLSSMSHELRTPMNAILGFSQLLEIDATLDSKQGESISEIRKAGNHLLHLINEVLDLARIESGQFALSTEPVLLAELVRESVVLIKPMAQAREIDICVDVEGNPVVMADHIRLKQVLLNLLSNAIKYNRVAGRLEIAARDSGKGRVCILVSDTGMGIPEASQQRVFEAFTRLHEGQVSVEGTGIGLTITRKLVDLMGGSISFESTVGVGSCFRVELPLAVGWASEPREDTAALWHGQPGSAASPSRHTLLLVDDNPANLRLVARILERVPEVELLTAYSASLGIELARAHKPALILLDINMPDMDGFKLLKLMRNDTALSGIPVFAITANALPSDIEKGKAAGFAEYLTKPLDIPGFIAQIKQQLGLAD